MKKNGFSAFIVSVIMSMCFAILPTDISPSVSAASKLSAPNGFTYSATTNSITLSWNKVKGADAYKVYMLDEGYSDDNQKLYMIGDDIYFVYKSIKGTQCTINDLDKGTEYTFVVSPLDKSGNGYIEGEKSGAINVKTKSATNVKTKTAKKQTAKTTKFSYPSLWDYGFKDASKIQQTPFDVRGYTYRSDSIEMFGDYLKAWVDNGYYVEMEEGTIEGSYFSGGAVVYKNTEPIAIIIYLNDVDTGLSTVSVTYI